MERTRNGMIFLGSSSLLAVATVTALVAGVTYETSPVNTVQPLSFSILAAVWDVSSLGGLALFILGLVAMIARRDILRH